MGRKAKIRKFRRQVKLIDEFTLDRDSRSQDLGDNLDPAGGSEIVKGDRSQIPPKYKGMLDNLRKHGLSDDLLINPPGQVKMSQVLMEFIEPFADFFDPEEKAEWELLIAIGIVAWNVSLFEPVNQEEMIDDFLNSSREEEGLMTQEDEKNMREIIEFMASFKNYAFSEYRRFIVDYDLGDDLNLAVTSYELQENIGPEMIISTHKN